MPDSFVRDVDSVLPYVWNWSTWLDGDTISSATVTGTSVTVDSYDNDTTTVTAWVSGGTVDVAGSITCQIVTAAGKTDERTIRLSTRER